MTTNSTITPDLLDQLLANYERPEDLTGDDGLFKQLKKALIERALGAELTQHLGYEKGDPAGRGRGNSRNGTSAKTVLTEDGEVEIAVPRDRAGSFEPQLIAKGQTRFDGFDDKILSLYARGMTVREIQGHLAELYGTEVSPDLISRVTDAVIDEVREWQNRPLDPVYPVVFFDALRAFRDVLLQKVAPELRVVCHSTTSSPRSLIELSLLGRIGFLDRQLDENEPAKPTDRRIGDQDLAAVDVLRD